MEENVVKKEIKNLENLKYVVAYPDDFDETTKYPVILFLHGAGSRGDDIEVVYNGLLFEAAEKYDKFPFVIVEPQCYEDTWFDMFKELKSFAIEVSKWKYVDSSRIYLMGASMGGYGTWQLAMSLPDLFAAIIPICGGGMAWNCERLKNTPVWAFHGGKDPVVDVSESIRMVEAVNKFGGNARLTIYPDNDHDAWTDTYNSYDVFEWLLSNMNTKLTDLTREYDDSKLYG